MIEQGGRVKENKIGKGELERQRGNGKAKVNWKSIAGVPKLKNF